MEYSVYFHDATRFGLASVDSLDDARDLAYGCAVIGYVAEVYNDGELLSLVQQATDAELALARRL